MNRPFDPDADRLIASDRRGFVKLAAASAGLAAAGVFLPESAHARETPRPVITSGAPPAAMQSVPYFFAVTATGSDVRYDAGGLPPGLTIGETTGYIMGIPTDGAERCSVQLVASNAGGHDLKVFPLSVSSDSPVITSGLLPPATVGLPYRFQVTASGTPKPYFTADRLPAGLDIDRDTGLISGTPLGLAGSAWVTVFARAAYAETSKNYTLVVRPRR